MSGGRGSTVPFTGLSLAELRRRASSERDDEALRLCQAVKGSNVPRKRTATPSFDELLAGVVDEVDEDETEAEAETSTTVTQQKTHTAPIDIRKRGKRSWAQRTIEKQRDGRRMK